MRINILHVAIDCYNLGVRHNVQRSPKTVRLGQQVVAAEQHIVVRRNKITRPIEVGDVPDVAHITIWLHSRIMRGNFCEILPGSIHTCIITHHQLEIDALLSKDRLDGCRQVTPVIVHWNKDLHLRLAAQPTISSSGTKQTNRVPAALRSEYCSITSSRRFHGRITRKSGRCSWRRLGARIGT